MGWYHVDRTGKGFCLGGETELEFNMEALGKYLPEKQEVETELRRIVGDAAEKYDEWPLLWKFAALDVNKIWDWSHGYTDDFERGQ